MAAESGGSLVGDVRNLLQDVVTPDRKALAVRLEAVESQVGELRAEFRRLDERMERRFDRIVSALDVYKEVQDLKEFRIGMEERQKTSA